MRVPASDRVLGEPLHTDRTVAGPESDVLRAVWEESAVELARLAGALGVPPDRADDVLQDVFLAALSKAPVCGDPTELRRWLFRVTINRCHLEHRRASGWQRVWQAIKRRCGESMETESAAAAAGRGEERALVRAALDRLAPRDRAVLTMRYFMQFDSKEIGRVLEMPDATVRSRLRTARRKLADELKRMGYRHE